MSEYTVTSQQAGQRLDKFLVEKLPDQTRSKIQKLIKQGGVFINSEKPTIHQFLKKNDVINISVSQASRPPLADKTAQGKSNLPAQAAVPELPQQKGARAQRPALRIISDTDHYIIINKPAGLLVHEAPGHTEPTLVDLVLKKYPRIAKIGEDPMRPGLVHRLDREVSGLITVAKTQDMFDHLKKQFKSRQIKKEYTALVYGAPQKPEAEISFNIDRSETTDHKMAAVPTHEERGRKAITEFEVVKHLGNYTLLKIKPLTGRTHQIRVHLNAYGLPIVGDQTYKPKKLKSKISMDRIFLHANYLGFKDLEDKWKEFTVSLPAELEDVLTKLRTS